MIRPILAAGVLTVLAMAAAAQTAPHQFLHNSAPAAPLFECGPQTMGQQACQAGGRCKCVYEPFGNLMLGLPPGSYFWDCNPRHGSCLVDIPAETKGNYGNPEPPLVISPFGVLR